MKSQSHLWEIWLTFQKNKFWLHLVIDGCGITSLDFTDDKSKLVQVMIWLRQAASHYPSQCWPIYGRHIVPQCWVTVIISLAIPVLTSHLWGETAGDRWFSRNQWCGAFMLTLLLVWIICWTNSRVAHGWRHHDANVISLYWLLVIFKMLSGPNKLILQNI